MPLSMTPMTMSSPRRPRSRRKPAVLAGETEKAWAGVGLDELGPVLPDVADVLPGAELAGLGGIQARGEAVQGVAVAVELVVAGADRGEDGIVFDSQALGVTPDVGSAWVEAAPGPFPTL